MAFFNIFRSPKPQQYRYVPRYYDPQKEDLKDRLEQVQKRAGNDPENIKARISAGFKSGHHIDRAYRRRQHMRSNYRLVAIIIALLFLAYWIIRENMPALMNFLE